MAATGKYDPKNDFGAQVRYLGTLIDGARTMTQHVDSQLNILIGFSTGLFAFAMALLEKGAVPTLPVLLLAGFSGLAAITALLGVHPPKLFRKRKQLESKLYHRELTKLTPKTATTRIRTLTMDPSGLTAEVTLEVYNMYKYYYQPKRDFFALARTMLMIGIIAALTSSVTELLVGSPW